MRDAIVIVLGAAAAVGAGALVWWWGFAIAFVVGHFFLFCNVFRMARPFELSWAALFIALSVATILLEAPGWPATISVSLAATVTVVALQMRKPYYHGVGWRRINPELSAWWQAQQAKGISGSS